MQKKTDQSELVRLLSRITLLTQLGLSVVTPPILCVLGALWLQKRFGLGDWVLLCAILLGTVSGVSGVFSFVRRETARDMRRDAGKPVSDTENRTNDANHTEKEEKSR